MDLDQLDNKLDPILDAEGADLAQLKPPHINPSDDVLALLGAKPERVPGAERDVEEPVREEVRP